MTASGQYPRRSFFVMLTPEKGCAFNILHPERGVFLFQRFNPNPAGRAVGDCVVRAVAAALDITWDDAYARVVVNGFADKDMPSGNSVLGSVLRQNGFRRYNFPETCTDCYTFADFARDNPKGVFVLGTGTHVATVRDGILMDAWDSSNEPVSFAWYRKD